MKNYLKLRKEELKKRGAKGFTLMEMLIVVAIIAVLIAIAIPIFTTQLEKSREATDLANVRSAYAELMTAAATSDDTARYTADATQVIKQGNGSYAIKVQLVQAQDGWQTDISGLTIAGVKATDSDHFKGNPTVATHTCTITYSPTGADGTAANLTFTWA